MTTFRKEFLSPTREGFYQEPVPGADFSARASLQSKDPWIVIGAVLHHAKHGHFSELERLVELLKNPRDAGVWAGCTEILGHTAPHSLMRRFLDEFRNELVQEDNWWLRAYTCEILCSGMMIEAVPTILRLYEATKEEDSQIRIRVALSFLLEPEDNWICYGPEDEKSTDINGGEQRYIEQVSQTYHKLRQNLSVSPDKVPVLEGRAFSVGTFAERFMSRLVQNQDTYRVARSRMMFEGNTGVDCRQFYAEDRLHPLSASAAVERFLHGPDLKHFEDGKRYFFGHVVPE